jgi:hypothetical protein
MQGFFGWFGKKKQPLPDISPASFRRKSPAQSSTDDREFPIENNFDDEEETNWDDTESLINKQIVYSQPIVPAVTPSPTLTKSDLDDWNEALPAATVKSSNIQEVRRGQNPALIVPNEDIWADQVASSNLEPSNRANPNPQNQVLTKRPTLNPVEQLIGLWSVTLQQLRRVLPAPIRQISDAILTGLVVAIITVTIWFIDGFFVPAINPVAANSPPTPITTLIPNVPNTPSPEQELINAVQAQLSEITKQYPDDVIQTLQIDVDRDLLVVRLNPAWYLMSDDRQNSVTDRMWQQAQSNHFNKLEIQDSQGLAIARSPVVGKHMIILQRRQSRNKSQDECISSPCPTGIN